MILSHFSSISVRSRLVVCARRMLLLVLALVFGLCAAFAEPAEQAAPEIKATVRPKQATVGSVLDYKININGKGLSAISIVPPEKREFYLEKKDAGQKQAAQAESQGEGQAEGEEEDPSKYVPLYIIHSVKKE